MSVSVNAADDNRQARFAEALRRYDATPDAAAATAVDAAAGQKDATVSRLFWHTDLPTALAEAKAAGKPVLSLRLLGRLDEDLSCANSRFFRTTLYANAQVSDYLRTNYVLHWQSVRPAPKLTIDYGDGRKIVTTITGNSVHYVLDGDGRVVDAIPGLYSPDRFLATLTDARQAAKSGPAARDDRMVAIAARNAAPQIAPATRPSAAAAGRLAMSKSRGEARPVRTVTGEPIAGTDRPAVGPLPVFDEQSLVLIRRKIPGDLPKVEVDKIVEGLRQTVTVDERINEQVLRPRIMGHMLKAPGESVDPLNAWVYANVFLTPDADPWLGLRSTDAFTGVDNGGVIAPVDSTASR